VKFPHPRLFEEIAWSTEHVFRQTLDRAAELGLDTVRLPSWYDVDDVAFAAAPRRRARQPGAGRLCAPHTTAFLRRLAPRL